MPLNVIVSSTTTLFYASSSPLRNFLEIINVLNAIVSCDFLCHFGLIEIRHLALQQRRHCWLLSSISWAKTFPCLFVQLLLNYFYNCCVVKVVKQAALGTKDWFLIQKNHFTSLYELNKTFECEFCFHSNWKRKKNLASKNSQQFHLKTLRDFFHRINFFCNKRELRKDVLSFDLF